MKRLICILLLVIPLCKAADNDPEGLQPPEHPQLQLPDFPDGHIPAPADFNPPNLQWLNLTDITIEEIESFEHLSYDELIDRIEQLENEENVALEAYQEAVQKGGEQALKSKDKKWILNNVQGAKDRAKDRLNKFGEFIKG